MATTSLGRYDLITPLGRGGMAEVWRAKARGASRFSRDVAIKVMLPEFAAEADVVSMFIDEACIAAKLEHPNIVQTHDFGRVGDRYFIVLELVEGVSLRSMQRIQRDHRLSIHAAIHVVSEIAAALDYAYAAPGDDGNPLRLVHRDVNPSNIMVTTRGVVKLADFGIAKTRMNTAVTQLGSLKGKIQYMSPEQAAGGALDARSDVYALGLTLYELLEGERALRGVDEIQVLEAARRGGVPRIKAHTPSALADIVARALAVDPAARFATAGEMRSNLSPFLEGVSPTRLQEDLATRVQETLVVERQEAASAPAPLGAARITPSDPFEGTEPATADHRNRGATLGSDSFHSSSHASRNTEAHPSSRVMRRIAAVSGGLVMVVLVSFGVARMTRKESPTPMPTPAPPVAQASALNAPSVIVPPPEHNRPVDEVSPPTIRSAKTEPLHRSNQPATLRISAEPWAQISIDGRDVGMTPLRPLDVSPGKHQIVASNPERGTKRTSVQLTAGERKLLQIVFDGPKQSR